MENPNLQQIEITTARIAPKTRAKFPTSFAYHFKSSPALNEPNPHTKIELLATNLFSVTSYVR